jgi:hypothetical protein
MLVAFLWEDSARADNLFKHAFSHHGNVMAALRLFQHSQPRLQSSPID